MTEYWWVMAGSRFAEGLRLGKQTLCRLSYSRSEGAILAGRGGRDNKRIASATEPPEPPADVQSRGSRDPGQPSPGSCASSDRASESPR
jgi:hypothetical protein